MRFKQIDSVEQLSPPWLDALGRDFDINAAGWYKANTWSIAAFAAHALRKGEVCYESQLEGIVDNKNFGHFIKYIEKYSKEMSLVQTNVLDNEKSLEIKKGSPHKWTIINDIATINFTLASEDDSSIYLLTTDNGFGLKIIKEFASLFEKKSERPGRVHLLESTKDGMRLVDFGNGGTPFLPENYDNKVVEDFSFVKEQLVSKTPNGRLFILNGPPGSGKTYFVRGLLQEVVGAVFLLVPSGQVGHLTQPTFLPVIRKLHETEAAPIVLVLEDADQALVPRRSDNMSIVSDILNFADGIVGSIIDVRILATTNAKNVEIEPALRRKRRLGREIHVGKLSAKKAEAIYKRLTGQDRNLDEYKFTLAEVYALADGESEESIMELNLQTRNRKTGF